jgi:hypothetical protein
MKKLLLLPALICVLAAQAQTATNFTVNDCAGNPQDLFSELNNGKVAVLVFVMPCSACATGGATAYSVAQGYETTNPGKVRYYVIDDYGNTSCATLNNWTNSNIASGLTVISDASVTEADYGSGGMPRIVVTGGGAHNVFFSKYGSAANDASGIGAAIDQALLATGVQNIPNALSEIALTTNGNEATLTYGLSQPTDVNITVYNMLGSRAMSVLNERQTVGTHETTIDLSGLSNGVYFVKMQTASGSQTVKFTVAR